MGNKTATFSLIMAVICFGIAVVPFLGLVLADDTVGRVIFTGMWAMLGFVWLGNYRRHRGKKADKD